MIRRKCFVSLLFVLLLCFVVVPVLADGFMVNNSTWWTYTDVSYSLVLGYGCGNYVGDDEYLVQASFYLRDGGSASGSVKAGVYNWTNTTSPQFLENSSNTCDLSALEDGVYTWFNFSFANTTLLNSACQYLFYIWPSGGPASMFRIGTASGGGIYSWTNTPSPQWTDGGSGAQFMLKVYTTAVSGGGSYTPPVEPSGVDVGDTISSLMWWFIYLVVMLAPAWFLGGYLKMGKWGFLMGLAIGSGIGYAFLSGFPLWLLLLVSVGEVGMFYVDVQKG